jgi:bifunctional UDP-N-acetylglucosamine pyrophosphorylase/glucosamine-1-phosphate N-acetyltransferase
MKDICVVILAAGEGKRMKSALPKVMHLVSGKPMVNHVVDAARALGAGRVIAVIAAKRPEVRDVLDKSVVVAVQKAQKGTGDAVKAAVKSIPANAKSVMVVYGDTPLVTEATLRGLFEAHRAANAAVTVLTMEPPDPKGYGRIVRNATGTCVGIVEDKDATEAQKAIREVNSGMYIFKKEALLEGLEHLTDANKSGEYYLTDVLGWVVRRGQRIEAYRVDDAREVLGVNSQRELLEASRFMRERLLERRMENGVVIEDATSVFIDGSAVIGAGTVIYPFTYIEKNVVVGRNCSLGPFCHLREAAVLEDGVCVGNFTEIKNSRLGAGTFMRHMSYVGDTSVGKNVNIGAGTVVANFDGKKKNRTVIQDKAFIGCDAVLIAPVTIGRGAIVGAGSVVTRNHNVADHTTVVGVPARKKG